MGKIRFTVVHREYNTIINTRQYKNKLYVLCTHKYKVNFALPCIMEEKQTGLTHEKIMDAIKRNESRAARLCSAQLQRI